MEITMQTRKHIPDFPHLEYDPETGIITQAGIEQCSFNDAGYLVIVINYERYLLHRIAWVKFYREQPPDQIDHIDRDKTNNRINNLRAATQSVNLQNSGLRRDNTSGVRGIGFCSDRNKYIVYIQHKGKTHNCGRYDHPLDAIEARLDAEEKFWKQVQKQAH